ncbi:hypothetical protein [Pseudomonas pohangensis]|nr:hypothetical protein [Pseudomonas pohangensis]
MSLLSDLFAKIEKGGAPRFVANENVALRAAPAAHPDLNQQHSSESAQECVDQRRAQKPAHAQHLPMLILEAKQFDNPAPYYIKTAATASSEWIAARDQWHNHFAACGACHAPTGRYCAAGAELRQRYNALTEEQAP